MTSLGHIVFKDGIETDPKKVTPISDWLVPRTVTEVQSFVGLPIIIECPYQSMPT